MRTKFLRISVLRVVSGHRVKLADCKSHTHTRWFILLTVLRRWSRCFTYLMVYSTRQFTLSLSLALCLSLYFQSFYHCDTSLGEERAGLCAFRTFVCLRMLVCVSFLFFLVSGTGCDL